MNGFTFRSEVLDPILKNIKTSQGDSFHIAGNDYTYAMLGRRVSAARYAIAEIGSDEQIFGLSIHDDLDTYAAIIALWLEGKAYVPLHPHQPLERNLGIIAQVGLHNIIDSAKKSVFEDWSKDVGNNVIGTAELNNGPTNPGIPAEVSEDALAYILFTSGSTGMPKGVTLSRGNLAAFMNSFWQTGINICPNDRCLQVFDLTFDVSVQSYLVALTRGACCYTVPYGQVKYLQAAALIQNEGITFGAMAPSMLTYLRPYFSEFDAHSLKACILTAEACPIDLIEDWYKCAGNAEIYDFYGPTETTIYCTYYKLTRGCRNLSLNGIVSIGKPLANVSAVIIDENGKIIEDSSKGELCVAGPQVTPGYWNNPEKNASSFFIMNGKRFYHTGDLCYRDESGNIMYSGRIDQQAKIQGFRVELGEIEYHAREFYNKERRVLAAAFQNTQNLTEIALFVEADQEDSTPLLKYLRSKMPHYMIPTHILYEPIFPLNKSEKVDRNALKQKLQ